MTNNVYADYFDALEMSRQRRAAQWGDDGYENLPRCGVCGTRHTGEPRGDQCALPDEPESLPDHGALK